MILRRFRKKSKRVIFNHFEDKITQISATEIASLLNEKLNPKSVVDIGCGLGYFLKAFKDLGVEEVFGIDGPWTNLELLKKNVQENEFIVADLTNNLQLEKKFDLLICLEVAEHIKFDQYKIFLKNLIKLSNIIVFSAAIPYQGGLNHLNEQWPDFWIDQFKVFNYRHLDVLREVLWPNKNIHWWYKQNMILFVKQEKYNEIRNLYNYSEKPFNIYVNPILYLKNSEKLNKILNGDFSLFFYMKIILKRIKKLVKS